MVKACDSNLRVSDSSHTIFVLGFESLQYLITYLLLRKKSPKVDVIGGSSFLVLQLLALCSSSPLAPRRPAAYPSRRLGARPPRRPAARPPRRPAARSPRRRADRSPHRPAARPRRRPVASKLVLFVALLLLSSSSSSPCCSSSSLSPCCSSSLSSPCCSSQHHTVPLTYRPRILAPVLAMDAAHMRGRQGATM